MAADDEHAADKVLNDAVLLHCRAQPHGGGGTGGGRVSDELGAALGFVARQGCGG